MNLHGTYTLHDLTPAQVWDGLLNPSLLIKVMPYAQNLTFLIPEERAVLNLYGTFGQPEPQKIQVELIFSDRQRPHQYNFQFVLVTETDTGSVTGEGQISLEQAPNQTDTTLHYAITGETQGVFLQTGELLLETITRGYMREMVTGLGSVLRQEELVTPIPATPPPPTSAVEPWIFATALAIIPLVLALIWRRVQYRRPTSKE